MMRFLAVLAMCGTALAQTLPQSPADKAVPPQPAEASTGQNANVLLPNLAPLPKGKPSLIGGVIRRVDRVHDELSLYIFGGKEMKVLFDERTAVYRDQARGSQRDLHQGQRVYVETVLDGSSIFARTIHLTLDSPVGECRGQVVSYDRARGELVVRDPLSPEPITLRMRSATAVTNKGGEASAQLEPGALVPGTLVEVQFDPGNSGAAIARQVSILATPGASFTFRGEVSYLDLHKGLLALNDAQNNKHYDIYFGPSLVPADGGLVEGAVVTVTAGFDGGRYVASSLQVSSSAQK